MLTPTILCNSVKLIFQFAFPRCFQCMVKTLAVETRVKVYVLVCGFP